MAPSRDKWVRRFVITETARHKQGFTIYKVTSLVFLKNTPDVASKVSVWKRYNDFKKLHKSLTDLTSLLRIREKIPPFPSGKYFSRFETEVIKERRDSAINLLEFIGRHPALFKSEIFVKFFETNLQIDTESIASDTSDESTSSCSNLLVPEKLYKNEILNNNQTQSVAKQPTSSNIISPLENKKSSDPGQYVLVAAAHMSAGYRHESMNEYEEAFIQYKLGIKCLSNGVQLDPDPVRRMSILLKIKKYNDRAESLYNKYLNTNIALLNKPIDDLKNYKVIKILNSIMLVKDINSNVEKIIKTIEKTTDENDDISNYILRGNVPFVVELHGFVQTEMAIFLILDYVKTGRLWELIKKKFSVEQLKNSSLSKSNCQKTEKIINNEQIDNQTNLNGKNSPTTQLLVNAQELLKSVDATIKQSNSIADRLNEKNPSTDEKISGNNENSIVNYEDNISELSFSDVSSTDSFEKVNLSDVCIDDYNLMSDNCKLNIYERNNSEANNDSGIEVEQELWRIPEDIIRKWSAQIILALECLHRQGIIMKNLKPQKLLIDGNDNILLCYVIPKKTQEFSVMHKVPYAAPELCNYVPDNIITGAVDVWSLGIILYELLTGIEFQARHSGPFYSHSILSIPNDLSKEAKSLLRSIIIFEPSERITLSDLKSHSFFEKINWDTIVPCQSTSII